MSYFIPLFEPMPRIVLQPTYSYDYYNRQVWPVLWPTDKDILDYKTWCKQHVGANNWNYYGQYQDPPYEFRFKRSEDLLAFRIRFGV